MKKYIGIVIVYHESMIGVSYEILSKTYDKKDLIQKWFDLYPNCDHALLRNTKELDSMFEIFEDMTPITDEEERETDEIKEQLRLKHEL